MKDRTAAGKIIISALEKMKSLAESKMKRLYMDNAKGKGTSDVTKHLIKKCIKLSKAAQNSSQLKAFAKRRFRTILSSSRVAIKEAPYKEKKLWSFAAIDAAEKSNYLAFTKDENHSPYTRFIEKGSNRLAVPETLLPWSKKRHNVSTKKLKAKVLDGASEACYLRSKKFNLYQVWIT